MSTQIGQDYCGQVVVVDIAHPTIYLGTLEHIDAAALVLTDCDIHDLYNSSKELYLLEARRNGFVPTRKRVVVMFDKVISISRLEDIEMF